MTLIVLLLLRPIAVSGQSGDVGSQSVGGNNSTGRPVPRSTPITRDGPDVSVGDTRVSLGELLPIYFPASPPILGATLPAAPAVRDAIWTELCSQANELFFAPLSTRLATPGNLNRALRQRLDAYKSTRTALLTELREGLSAAPARLGELAAIQEPKLAALATQADELRRELYQGGFRSGNGDWNAHRNWRIGEKNSKRTPREQLYDEVSVLRAAIYYQEGLSPAQRRLLREVVISLTEALGEREAESVADSFEPQQVIFFLPHSARINVPSHVPAELAAQIAAFTSQKAELKRELRDALVSLDSESRSRRERSLRELATAQESRFAALESSAEQIRTALARLPDAPQTPAYGGLPPALTSRIDAYLREKTELQKAAQRASGPGTLADFEENNRTRFAALTAEARAIREEVARAAAATGGAGKSVDTLLADFMTAFRQQQLLSLHQDFRTAILRPGLSPLQRQLLFDAAVAAFDLTGEKDWQAVPE
jgi:hypothetical protein